MFELFHVTGNRGQTEVFSQIDHRTLEKAHDTNFLRMIKYDLGKKGSLAIDSNMTGKTPKVLATEYEVVHKVHPKLRQAALHVSISAATGEKLTDDQWRELAKRFMDGMGLDNNQYFITRHTNTEHEHIHILVNRIQFDGRVTDASWDYLRCQKIMRELERDFGLQAVPSSRDVGRKELTWREVEFCLRTGIPSQRMQLQELCDAAAMDCKSFSQYQARLEAMGVELVPFIQNEGATLRGICYRLDEVIFKGREDRKSVV